MSDARTVTDVRDELLDFVEADLVGPAHGETEVLEDSPYIRYAAGVLFPQEVEIDESASIRGSDADEHVPDVLDAESIELSDVAGGASERRDSSESEQYDDPVTLANEYKPSAIGLTFALPLDVKELQVGVTAAVYDSETRASADGLFRNTFWTRRALNIPTITLEVPVTRIEHFDVVDGLKICLLVSRESDRSIVTASLYNTTRTGIGDAKTFFQTSFAVACVGKGSEFVEYREVYETDAEDEEELSLEMMYRDRRVFAIGHGCAADWKAGRHGAAQIMTSAIPRVVVPPVEPRSGDHRYLNMQFLQGDTPSPEEDIPAALNDLCDSYAAWVSSKRDLAGSLDARFDKVANENLQLCQVAIDRMRSGIELLSADDKALEAFMLANRAILMQQYHYRLPARKLNSPPNNLPSWNGYSSHWPQRRGYWRTFQLAFILMALPGLVSEDAEVDLAGELVPSRDLVDLIWFPTGGGKTEAYLGISAFLILLGRLRDPKASGCKVLMRYTLRLLTSQQFQRAAALLCACDEIRAHDSDRLGEESLSIGLWVGMSLTPNAEKDAKRAVTQIQRKGDEAKNPFQLLSCPWCGTQLNDKRRLGYQVFRNKHSFVCPNDGDEEESACPFSSPMRPLPVSVVDESIYQHPPTLLIGTVDKFAMLAWRRKAGEIFRVGGGPDLIIQDELHLISGPLGSMVGLYEGVIEYLSSNPRPPKIIASTATIRRAREQCWNLYARPMFQFPPPGLDASDSYFAVESTSSPGRLYAGFLPTAASSPLTAQIRSVVALQQGLKLIGSGLSEELIDPYWTLVQYFGSLKELGRAATFVTADIPEFLPTMHRRYDLKPGDDPDNRRYMNLSVELTSRQNEDEIPRILAKLEERYRKAAKFEEQALDTVLATNMISVGVDIDRLGLMMVVTQPKGTSEYIQASSRVGRSSSAPGLVMTLYNAGRPRDRSHYEQFRPYHDAFYRYVEPTSVTPFSPPALDRALHAILVVAGRHIAGWVSPEDFDSDDPKFKGFIDFLRARVEKVDPLHIREFEGALSARIDEWEHYDVEGWGDISQQTDQIVLMRPAGRPAEETATEGWEVPTSMRNVDVACGAEVVRYIV